MKWWPEVALLFALTRKVQLRSRGVWKRHKMAVRSKGEALMNALFSALRRCEVADICRQFNLRPQVCYLVTYGLMKRALVLRM